METEIKVDNTQSHPTTRGSRIFMWIFFLTGAAELRSPPRPGSAQNRNKRRSSQMGGGPRDPWSFSLAAERMEGRRFDFRGFTGPKNKAVVILATIACWL